VLSKQQNRFKPGSRAQVGGAGVRGFFHDPLKTDLKRSWPRASPPSAGDVVLETQGGTANAIAIESSTSSTPRARPTPQAADWGRGRGRGLHQLFGMSSTLWAEVNRN
jgi:argininosuccinate synthase